MCLSPRRRPVAPALKLFGGLATFPWLAVHAWGMPQILKLFGALATLACAHLPAGLAHTCGTPRPFGSLHRSVIE